MRPALLQIGGDPEPADGQKSHTERRLLAAASLLRACFHSVERVETAQVHRLGRTLMDADVFVCSHYLGPVGPQRVATAGSAGVRSPGSAPFVVDGAG